MADHLVEDILEGLDSVDSTLASDGYHEGSLVRGEVAAIVARIVTLNAQRIMALTRVKTLEDRITQLERGK